MLRASAAPSLGRVKLFETRPRRLRGGGWTLPGQRLAELELLINARFGPRGVETDDWGVIAAIGLNHLVAHVRLLPVREDRPQEADLCRSWMSRFCPCVDQAAADELIAKVIARPRKFRADTLAKLLNVTDAERRALGLRTIGATDRDAEARKADRRAADRERKRAARKAAARPRKPTLAESRPWVALGMSRATWYRKGRPTPAAAPRPVETKSVRNNSYRGYVVTPYIADAKNLTLRKVSKHPPDQARSRHPNPPAGPSEIAVAARRCAARVAAISRPVINLAAALRALGRAAAAVQEEVQNAA